MLGVRIDGDDPGMTRRSCRPAEGIMPELKPTYWVISRDPKRPVAGAATELFKCDKISEAVEGARLTVERQPTWFSCAEQLSGKLAPEDITMFRPVKCFGKAPRF